LFGKAAVLELEYLQCVAKLAVFEGKGVTKLLEVRQFYGNAFELIEQTERFILDRTRIISELRPDEFRRRDTPEIPVLALREAIANAVAHREYHTASGSISAKIFDDRVEITSVGSLHFNLSPDQLYQPHEARPWNPNIANMLYRRGTVETLGTGTLRMMDHACTASLPMPLITADNQSVKVTFSRYDHIPPQLAEFKLTLEQLRVLRAIRASEPASRSKIAEEANLPDRTTRTLLDHLRSKQLADFTGERATARWHLTGPARLTYGLDPLPTK
jgi:ATP-dependent DNA helicase RecG